MSGAKRYIGIDLSGARNHKTTLAVLEYFPKERRTFVLDLHPGIGPETETASDDVLIQSLTDHADRHPDLKIGVNAALSLPPCIRCTRKTCPTVSQCTVPEVKWMRSNLGKKKQKEVPFATPYTQRPIELYLKNEILPRFPEKVRFEIDETLGGNRAPLTARMMYLQHHLQSFSFHEVHPKLSVACLMPKLKLSLRSLRQYRQLEDGVVAREQLLEKMCEHLDLFIYDRDFKKLTTQLNAFDAFLSAYTVLLMDRGECQKPPRNFPVSTGWIYFPESTQGFAEELDENDSED